MYLAPYHGTCFEQYVEWFRSVSHSYVINMAEDDRVEVIPSEAPAHKPIAMHPWETHPEHPALVCMNH